MRFFVLFIKIWNRITINFLIFNKKLFLGFPNVTINVILFNVFLMVSIYRSLVMRFQIDLLIDDILVPRSSKLPVWLVITPISEILLFIYIKII